MTGEERREQLVSQLTTAEKALSASYFAKVFGVSRQIIVGDVALIRAAGYPIRATAKGYLLGEETKGDYYYGQVACQHQLLDSEVELTLIVELGGIVENVSVDHPIYGELTGNLDIRNQGDVTNFMTNIREKKARLLLDLTDGIHLHRIACRNQTHYEEIKEALHTAGFLYQEK